MLEHLNIVHLFGRA